ncbi:indolepyruvate ferredoxin oxidoreductase subunit alpha [Schlesneria sp. DSM 10557]|uniref:indolepyruvate ferredoxin oxidoreductase subunit alpha n=1 Tax=Schlesneria sp. DSM 10557 TaxID=3044399 RepID=UPI0035A12AF3
MPMVVTQLCHGCKAKDCVAVCPADCFHEGEFMLYIHPDKCIDCGLCAPECPQQAIYYDDRLPPEFRNDLSLNRQMSQCCPSITAASLHQAHSSPSVSHPS